ncbi:MAG TPA: hypothetical protein VGJ94_15010 [Syntrophorhabdaceae bacterium]
MKGNEIDRVTPSAGDPGGLKGAIMCRAKSHGRHIERRLIMRRSRRGGQFPWGSNIHRSGSGTNAARPLPGAVCHAVIRNMRTVVTGDLLQTHTWFCGNSRTQAGLTQKNQKDENRPQGAGQLIFL